MRKLILALILLVGCASSSEWTGGDKALHAKFTAEYNGNETLLKFDGKTVVILGSN